MNFNFPLGLIALIAIPIIIILYLLLQKYQEKQIASTYIWKVSERLEKKKVPLNNVSQPWIMVLQCFIALILAFASAAPLLNISKAENYYFILDNSGSMSITENGSSRFDRAKDEITNIVKKSKNGSLYSLLLTCGNVQTLLHEVNNKDDIYSALNNLSVSNMYSTNQSVINTIQDDFLKDTSIHAYLISDKEFESTKNIDTINVSNHAINYAVETVDYKIENGHIYVNGKVCSYETDANLNVRLLINDIPMSSLTIEAKKLVKENFEFSILDADFEKISVEITNSDALDLDNKYTIFKKVPRNSVKVAIVSNSPFYLDTIISTLISSEIDFYTPNTYLNETGYDLYVFDGFAPTNLPTDGGIWMFNVAQNIASSGFIYQNQLILDNGGLLTYATNDTSDFYQTLTSSVLKNPISISKYLKYSIYNSFTSILTYEGQPVVFAGLNENNTRQIVFAFDLHDSNLPLLLDFIVLMRNFLNYSVPEIINQSNYACGSDLAINILPNCESIELTTPSNQTVFLNVNDEVVVNYKLIEVGEYVIQVKIGENIQKMNLYSYFSTLESNPTVKENSLILQGEKSPSKIVGTKDLTNGLLGFSLLLLLLDWILYFLSKL